MRVLLIILGFVLWPELSHAATTLQPGEWQTTETGTEDGKPVPPQVEKDCMSPEEARDATNVVNEMKKQMVDAAGAKCERYDVKQSGETVTFAMKCGVPQQFALEMSGSFTFVSATRYSGAMKSAISFGGKTTTMDKKVEAVRVGECKPGQAKKK